MNGTETIADAGPYSYTSPMTATLIGYARCSTDQQDLAAQRHALLELGVAEDRIYTDHDLTGTSRARPGLDQALAAVRQGDTLVVPKLDRLARSESEYWLTSSLSEKQCSIRNALGNIETSSYYERNRKRFSACFGSSRRTSSRIFNPRTGS